MINLAKLKKENRIFLIIFLILLGLAVMDVLGISLWETATYSSFYWTGATLVMILIAFVWWLATNDRSEALSIGIGSKIMLMFGLEDLLFYIISDRTFNGGSMPHLFSHYVMGPIAKAMGLSTVTPFSLLISVGIGLTITYFIVKFLVRRL